MPFNRDEVDALLRARPAAGDADMPQENINIPNSSAWL